jgi:hypothetical protein
MTVFMHVQTGKDQKHHGDTDSANICLDSDQFSEKVSQENPDEMTGGK